MATTRVVHNRLLGGWYIVTGKHQTPLGGRFDSKAAAEAALARSGRARCEALVYHRATYPVPPSRCSRAAVEGSGYCKQHGGS